MNTTQHLLIIAMEECAELAQRLSKAIRFGLDEVQDHQSLTNTERIVYEYSDLVGVLRLLDVHPDTSQAAKKQQKVQKYLAYSASLGLLDDTPEKHDPSAGTPT